MRINKDFWLLTKPVAHRGLWGNDIVENSLSAYNNAILNGYPIEIDLYPTFDGEIVCFHDPVLDRMTNGTGKISDKTLSELKSLTLTGSNESIPTFDEVLSLCEGKTPLLIEIKPTNVKGFVEKIVARLKRYKGEFAVQSFNPIFIKKVKKLAPEFIRGILATEDKSVGEKWYEKLVLRTMCFNPIIKPDFISYSYTGLPLGKKNKKNLPVIAWTVSSQKIADDIKGYADNIIFENFIPKV